MFEGRNGTRKFFRNYNEPAPVPGASFVFFVLWFAIVLLSGCGNAPDSSYSGYAVDPSSYEIRSASTAPAQITDGYECPDETNVIRSNRRSTSANYLVCPSKSNPHAILVKGDPSEELSGSEKICVFPAFVDDSKIELPDYDSSGQVLTGCDFPDGNGYIEFDFGNATFNAVYVVTGDYELEMEQWLSNPNSYYYPPFSFGMLNLVLEDPEPKSP